MPVCPECHGELPEGAKEGLCSKCLMVQGLKIVSALASPGLGPSRSDLPRNFGDYELLEEIARGGMGIVYKARQRSLDRIVAVKTLLLSAHGSPEFVKRFRAEASAAASLRHPNIVAIHEVGMHQDEHYLVMDYVAGPTLAKFIKGKPLPVRQAAGYLKTIAEAIHYAHERGILHRDLKPSNVLIGSNDEPLVTDFGLAKRLEGDSSLTLSGQVVGSPSYMPPEQAAGTRGKVGRRSDVYSLGAMLYHLLTDRPPFVGETLNEILDQVFNREPLSPRLLNPAAPRDLETICLKCLEKEREKRYATAQEVGDELGRFLRVEPIIARPLTRAERAWRWCRRKPALASLAAATILLLLALAIGAPIAAVRIAAARDAERRERLRAEQNLYVSEVRLAGQALEDYNLLGARERLQRIAASPRQREMRGWEWRYLIGRCRGDELMTLGRHDSWISGLALSSEDKLAASISEDGVVKLWDFAARKEVIAWQAHTEPAKQTPGTLGHALAFSPDGHTVATGGRDQFVRLWKVPTWQKLAEMEKLDRECSGVTFSPDGRMLAAVSVMGQISLWSLSNNPPVLLNRWDTEAFPTFTLAFYPNETNLATAGFGQRVRLWNISDPRTPRESAAFDGTAFPAAFSPDGKWVVASGDDTHALRRWELPARRERPRWPGRHAQFMSLAFSPDSGALASGLTDGEIVLWDMAGEREPITLMGHEEYVTGLTFSRDGRMLISASWDKTVRLWDLSKGERAGRIVRHGFSGAGVCFSPDSRYLASVARDRTPREDRSPSEQHTLKLWEVSSMTEVTNTPTGGTGFNSYPAFSRDGKLLAVDGSWKPLQIYSVPSLGGVTNLRGFNPAFSTDGRSIVYASGQRIVWRDSLAVDAVETVIGEFSANIISLALSPDEKTVACSADNDHGQGIQFWDVRERRRLGTVTEHEGRVVQMAFSPDGQRFASAGWDGKVGVWDVNRRRLIKLLRGDSGELYGVAFSPDGRTLAACGSDAAIRLWNVTTLQEIAFLRVRAGVQAVSFSPDGQWLAAAAGGGTIHVWQAPSFAEIESAGKRQAAAP